MSNVFLVELDVIVRSGRRLADEEITDLVEVIIDDLDGLADEPSVGTVRVGDDVSMTVGVAIEAAEELEAMNLGLASMKAAFHAAGLGTAGLELDGFVSRVRPVLAV